MGLFKLTRGVHGWDQEMYLDSIDLDKTYSKLSDIENTIIDFYERHYYEEYTERLDEFMVDEIEDDMDEEEVEQLIEQEWYRVLNYIYTIPDPQNKCIKIEHEYFYLIDGDKWYIEYTDDLVGVIIEKLVKHGTTEYDLRHMDLENLYYKFKKYSEIVDTIDEDIFEDFLTLQTLEQQ